MTRVTLLAGGNGSSVPLSSAAAGNVGMYTTGSCARGFGTFFGGPRLVFYLSLGAELPLGGVLTLTTCGVSSDNTVLYVGTGCPTWFGSFACISGNDDAGDGGLPCAGNARASSLSFTASSRYFFVQVGAAGGGAVTSGLRWSYQMSSGTPTRSRTASRTRTRSATRSASRSATRSMSRSRSRKAKRALV